MRRSVGLVGWGLATWILVGCGSDGDGGSAADSVGGGALVDLVEEAPGSHCASGGTKLVAGRDANDDGKLDEDEVETERYVCHGDTGAEGPDGTNGDDGANGNDGSDGVDGSEGDDGDDGSDGDDGESPAPVLIELEPEPAGAACATGGQKVTTGVDANRSGTLESTEVGETEYVCNGQPGTSGVGGFRLIAKVTAAGGPIAEIVAASPDGKTLAFTSSASQTVGFLDLTNPSAPVLGTPVAIGSTVPSGNGEATSVAITPNGTFALVAVKDTTNPITNADPGALVFIDLQTRAVVASVAVGVGPDSVHVTPDGTKAVIAIEDEENEGGNGAAQSRPGSVQVVTLDYATPANSVVSTIALSPTLGNMPTDPQPELVDITPDGKLAVVSLQENNALAVIDLETNEVLRYIDGGTSVHARADLTSNASIEFDDAFEGQIQPDGVCILADGVHFVTANEGDTPNQAFGGVYAGGRGFSVFNVDGTRVYDSGDAAEWRALRAGAYPESRSGSRGIEMEGCASGVFGGTEFAFLLGERNSSMIVADVTRPAQPILRQILGTPMRPESAVTIASRGLVVVSGEGDGTGGGLWVYQAVQDPAEAGHGEDVYVGESSSTPFSALGALAYEPATGFLLSTPDNAFAAQRIWSFWPDHASQKMQLVRELMLEDASGAQLTGYDPEGLVVNPEGGYIIASEGIAGNGPNGTCVGTAKSNRILFFDESGRLDSAYGNGGIVDLPCGAEPNAFNWANMTSNGYEGLTVVDTTPGAAGGLEVYVAFQRALTGEGQNTRIGRYAVDTGLWSFYFYTLEPNPGGAAGNTFLSELIHVGGDTFAVIERDQGWAGAATNKTIRTFSLSTGAVNDMANPVDKVLAVDLLAHRFRFDQEKIEGLALGAGGLWVTNDNDGGLAMNYFLRLEPSVLGSVVQPEQPDPVTPGQDDVRIHEVNSQGTDFVELENTGTSPVDVGGWVLRDSDPANGYVLPQGTTIAPGGLLLVEGDASGAPLHLSFGLGSADAISLETPVGVVVDQYSWAAHVASASLCPSLAGMTFWAPTPATPGTANNCTAPTVPGQTSIVVNEINSSGNDFVELYNTSASTVSLAGWVIQDNDASHAYVLPAGTSIAAGAYLLIEGDSSTAPLHLNFGLGGGDSVKLFTPYDVVVAQYTWVGQVASTGRCPAGTGAFTAMTPTPGAANACP